MTTTEIPPRLSEMLDLFSMMEDRQERIQMLIGIADQFKDVPPEVAMRPFPEANRVKHCESEAFIWAIEQPDGALKYHFAVENPQGISAKAMAAILDQTCSGEPAEQVARIPTDIAYTIFGRELSMGKNMGLTSMVQMVKAAAEKHAATQKVESR